MLTARGFIRSNNGVTFTAVFLIDGLELYGSGKFLSASVPPFRGAKASLVYNSPNDLTYRQEFTGFVGEEVLALGFKNGSSINATLDEFLPEKTPVGGVVSWVQS
ncbi:hypothetical protein BDZ97DRAFT_545432 [Flammula alnicola]|nr:hypothetical protein BDZ97DRAFT_545432 [Flammula alnicola]